MKVSTIFEFYFELGQPHPTAYYRLDVFEETEKTYKCTVCGLKEDGTNNYSCNNAMLLKATINETRWVTAKTGSRLMIRVPCINFCEALILARKSVATYLRTIADQIYVGDHNPNSSRSDLPISIGSKVYVIRTDRYGCHACPHGNQPMRHLCHFTCPEPQFRIEEVIVESIPQVCDLANDGRIVLKDGYCLNLEDAEAKKQEKIEERKQNKLAFDLLQK